MCNEYIRRIRDNSIYDSDNYIVELIREKNFLKIYES